VTVIVSVLYDKSRYLFSLFHPMGWTAWAWKWRGVWSPWPDVKRRIWAVSTRLLHLRFKYVLSLFLYSV